MASKNGSSNGHTAPEHRPATFLRAFEASAEASATKISLGKRNPETNKTDWILPNWGAYPVSHITSFQSLVTSTARVYRQYDEAVKHSLDNARFMRNDCGIMECVEARQRCVSLLNWHLEPEDETSNDQRELCKELTKILLRIRRFIEYQNNLLHAPWFGRYAIQHQYGWQNISGHMRLMPTGKYTGDTGWSPIHGDKLCFRFDDGTLTEDQYDGQVGIRVGMSHIAAKLVSERRRIETTDRGMAYFLNEDERRLIAIHKHMIEDGEYEDALSAGKIHGVGIRSRIYWEWVQKQETLGFLMEYLERCAGGIQLWHFPAGNVTAKRQVEESVAQFKGGSQNVILVPIPAGDDGHQYGVQTIEPGMAGIDMLKDLVDTHFGHRMKRYILGQVLTSEAQATGLGSGVADAHMDTLHQIVKYDATNLEETITFELLQPIKEWNFPAARNIHVRFVKDTESDDAKEKLEGYQIAYQMGASIKEKEVMELVGAAMPGVGDSILSMQAQQQQQQDMQTQAMIQQQKQGIGAGGVHGIGMPGQEDENDEGEFGGDDFPPDEPQGKPPAPDRGGKSEHYAASFKESEHPRGPDGQFIERFRQSHQQHRNRVRNSISFEVSRQLSEATAANPGFRDALRKFVKSGDIAKTMEDAGYEYPTSNAVKAFVHDALKENWQYGTFDRSIKPTKIEPNQRFDQVLKEHKGGWKRIVATELQNEVNQQLKAAGIPRKLGRGIGIEIAKEISDPDEAHSEMLDRLQGIIDEWNELHDDEREQYARKPGKGQGKLFGDKQGRLAWNEEDHPRVPAGSPEGGQFADAEGGNATTGKKSLIDFLKGSIDSRGLFVDDNGENRGGDWFRQELDKRGDSIEEQREAIRWLREHGTPAQQRWQLGEFSHELRKATGHTAAEDRSYPAEEQEQQRELQADPAQAAETEPETKPQKSTVEGPHTLERHGDIVKRLRSGDMTPEEWGQHWENFKKSVPAIREELSKRTMKQLAPRGAGGKKKAEVVESIIDNMASRFTAGEGYSFSPPFGQGREAFEKAKHEAIDAVVKKLTPEHFQKLAEGHAAARADYEQQKAAHEKAIADPQTLEDFKTLVAEKGEAALTPEQSEKYDDLQAEARRSRDREKKATVQGFEGGEQKTGGIGIVKGHHQKRNQETHTVTVENRLGTEGFQESLRRAKQLGGSYVNAMIAKRYGATAGFQFFNEDNAKKFADVLRGESADRSESLEERDAAQRAGRAESLGNRAESLEERANETLGQNRLTNTARRAEMAASINARARAQQAEAKTLAAISQKMAGGELKHLNGVKAMTHTDTLDWMLNRARWERYREATKGKEHIDWQKFHEAPEGPEDIAATKYPYPSMWASDLRQHAKEFADVPGLKKIAASLKKAGTIQPKFQGSVSGFSAGGGQIVDPKQFEEQVSGAKLHGIPDDKHIRVHASYDWRLGQKAGGEHKLPFYTADKGKTWGTTPTNAIGGAYNKGHELDLVDAPKDERITFDQPGDIEKLATAASRLRRSANPNHRRIGERLADELTHYNRLQAMDIKSPAELRAALREYLPLKSGAEKEDPVKAKERALIGQKIPGFFPTPRPLIDRMLDAAGIEPGHDVLEPSAGKGDILDAIRERHPEAQTTGVEQHASLRDILGAKGHNLADSRDFLQHQGQHDRIVMNPPFENGQDMEHVRHAFEQLKPGGRLVAVMSQGPFFRGDKKSTEFRDWLDSIGGEHEDLPEGSFAGSDAFRQTGVNTRLVTIDKPLS